MNLSRVFDRNDHVMGVQCDSIFHARWRAAYTFHFHRLARRSLVVMVIGLGLVMNSACGGSNGSETGANTAIEAAVPTMPPAQFTAVSSQSAFTQTTDVANGESEASSQADLDLERGARSYAKNNCASCHGEQGEGVAGKGESIVGMTLSLNEFDTLLRTGGGLGNDHIFGPSAVSPTGMELLFEYVKSLGQ